MHILMSYSLTDSTQVALLTDLIYIYLNFIYLISRAQTVQNCPNLPEICPTEATAKLHTLNDNSAPTLP